MLPQTQFSYGEILTQVPLAALCVSAFVCKVLVSVNNTRSEHNISNPRRLAAATVVFRNPVDQVFMGRELSITATRDVCS